MKTKTGHGTSPGSLILGMIEVTPPQRQMVADRSCKMIGLKMLWCRTGWSKIILMAIVCLVSAFHPILGADVPDVRTKTDPRAKDLPKGFAFSGKPRFLTQWMDKNGSNALILCVLGPQTDADNPDASSIRLFAYHVLEGSPGQAGSVLWTLTDGVEGCSVNLDAGFLGEPRVTDLDQNGVAETTVLYTLTCRSDVSRAPAKLIMHEGKKKFAIRGEAAMPGISEVSPGDMSVDASFDSAPKLFRDYAIRLWQEEIASKQL